jgi:hypothetical protein
MRKALVIAIVWLGIATPHAGKPSTLASDGFLIRRHTVLEGFDQQTGAALEIDEVIFSDGLSMTQSMDGTTHFYVRAQGGRKALTMLMRALAVNHVDSLAGECAVPLSGPTQVTGLATQITWFGKGRQHSFAVGDSSKSPTSCSQSVLGVLSALASFETRVANDPGSQTVQIEDP